MANDFQIVMVPSLGYDDATLVKLTVKARELGEQGWKAEGAPFYLPGSRTWCLAMVKTEPNGNGRGDLKIKEPRK